MYDSMIILSQNREIDGSLGWELKLRADYGIRDYLEGKVSSLTMSGKNGRGDAHLETSQAEDMRDYAVSRGIPIGHIFVEPNSVDTVGQAIFTNRDVIKPKNIENVIIVTSDYHLTRVATVFDFVFGDSIRKLYASISTDLIKNPEIRVAQEKSLEAFFRTFDGVERGNLDAILERLFEKHPLYKGTKK